MTGVQTCALPIFGLERLVRLTPPIEALEADYWLLVHPDLKAVPRVRHVMERICGVFRASRAALGG